MNVRKLLARLNPSTQRYQAGNGGTPELTPQDIAAALGMVPAGIGREILTRIWWPDGASLSPGQLAAEIARIVRVEMEQRQRTVMVAKLQLHIAQEELIQTPTDNNRREVARAEAAVEQAKGQQWPANPGMHLAVRRAVLDELSKPSHCPHCGGLGDVQEIGGLVKTCPLCEGAAIKAMSDSARARAINRDESSYRAAWRGLYEWLYDRLRDAEADAARELAGRLG